MRLNKVLLVTAFLISSSFVCADKIGLLIVATGQDISFVKPLIDSANKYFCPGHEITYFIFTDGDIPKYKNVVRFHQHHLPSPYGTLLRGAMYLKHAQELQKMDYLFACDANMLFVDTVGNEILAERVATQHPEFIGTYGKYESRALSTAYVRHGEGIHYFTRKFYGGTTQEFLKMARTVVAHIFTDLDKNIIAEWQDESHQNRYFIDNPPTKILSPSYCYPKSSCLPHHKRICVVDTNCSELRSE